MKADKGQIDRALKAPAGTRFFLLYGQDESGSRALMRLLGDAMGKDAERVDLAGAELRADPARLADEAGAISLFGGARYIVVDPAGDETLAAVEALQEAPAGGNPVVLLAGALKPTSKLLKMALADPSAMAFASYLPDARDAGKLTLDLARQHGVQLTPDVARRIADGAGGNRSVIAQELEKFALYVDAAPDRPQPVDHDVIDAVGAASDEGDVNTLAASVTGGDLATLESELLRLKSTGTDGIRLTRALLRRMALLSRLRAEVERGNSVSTVMASQGKAIFWKERDAMATQLSRWRSDLLAKGVSRLLEAERQAMTPGGPGPLAIDEELFAICRQAARLR